MKALAASGKSHAVMAELLQNVTSDEIHISSHIGQASALDGIGMGSTGGDGAEQEADGSAGLGLEVLPLLQALADQDRMGEGHDRAHELRRGRTRSERFELAR